MRSPSVLLCAALLGAACLSHDPAERGFETGNHVTAPSPAFHLGDYRLASRPVVDGDTIRVRGLDAALRLVGTDAEEVFYSRVEREQATRDFESYAEKKRAPGGRRPRLPRKYATPMGEKAKRWLAAQLDGAAKVRVEIDRLDRIEGFYRRKLAHVFVERDGSWVHLNSELVRAGMSPYFVKYGRARRFHSTFVEAEQQARAAGRGIWSRETQHYDDYDQRLAWWQRRAEKLAAFDEKYAHDRAAIALLDDDAWGRLRASAGRELLVFGELSDLWADGPMTMRHRKDRFVEIRCARDEPLRARARATSGEFVELRVTIQWDGERPFVRCGQAVLR